MAAPDGPDGQTGDSAFHLIQYESERQLPEWW